MTARSLLRRASRPRLPSHVPLRVCSLSRLRSRLRAVVFTLVVALLLAGELSATEVSGWYASNVDYMALDPLPSGPGAGWVLEIGPRRATDEGFFREERTLYLDGEAKGREIYRYSQQGLPVEIRRIEPAESEPREVFRVSLRYRPDGTIRSVERCAGEDCILVRYAPPGPDGVERVRGRDLLLGIHYGPEGKPVYIRREQSGDPVEEEWFVYGEGRLRSSRTRVGGEETVRTYEAGRIVREELSREGRTVRTVTMEYDREGELQERVTTTRARTEREVFFPRPPSDMLTSDEVIRERYVDGALVEQERVHDEGVPEGGSRSITRLQRGEIVFRSWYEDDRLLRREIYSEGHVIHVEYPREESRS
jgi:hypothetical protein